MTDWSNRPNLRTRAQYLAKVTNTPIKRVDEYLAGDVTNLNPRQIAKLESAMKRPERVVEVTEED